MDHSVSEKTTRVKGFIKFWSNDMYTLQFVIKSQMVTTSTFLFGFAEQHKHLLMQRKERLLDEDASATR